MNLSVEENVVLLVLEREGRKKESVVAFLGVGMC